MGLTDTISNFFGRLSNREQTTFADTDVQVARISRGPSGIMSRFSHQGDSRRDQILISRQMYKQDTRAKSIIKTMARDAVKGGFQLEIKGDGNEKAQQVAAELFERLKLSNRLDDWVRLTLRDGDSMIEVGVDKKRNIAKVSRKPTLNMFRNSNDRDEFSDPKKAYWYAPNQIVGDPTGRNDVVWFAEWQIVHARYDHDEGDRYGNPIMAPAERSYKRMNEGETDVAVRRKTRAGIKFAHNVGKMADQAAVDEYIERNKAALDDPFAAAADFFLAGDEAGIDVLSGDNNLGMIDDIRHHLDTFFLASPVPRSVLGYGQDINYSVVEHQKEQYDETMGEFQTWVATQFIVPLLERQWLLSGILPERLDYMIKWPGKKVLTVQDIELLSKAIVSLQAAGIPATTIARIMSRYIPGVDPDDLMPEADGLEMNRLANIAGLIGQTTGQNDDSN